MREPSGVYTNFDDFIWSVKYRIHDRLTLTIWQDLLPKTGHARTVLEQQPFMLCSRVWLFTFLRQAIFMSSNLDWAVWDTVKWHPQCLSIDFSQHRSYKHELPVIRTPGARTLSENQRSSEEQSAEPVSHSLCTMLKGAAYDAIEGIIQVQIKPRLSGSQHCTVIDMKNILL